MAAAPVITPLATDLVEAVALPVVLVHPA